MCKAIVKPIADHKLYRPPTQSQKPNIFFSSMPNSLTLTALVDKAQKCLATALISPPAALKSHSLAVVALVMVSWVVKVFEAITNKVVSGLHFFKASAI